MVKAHRISHKKFGQYKSFRALSTQPNTQLKYYEGQGAPQNVLTLVKQSPNKISTVCKDIAREDYHLEEPPSEVKCDHVDLDGNTYRQVSTKYTSTGRFGSWEHIQPSREWDYLLLVELRLRALYYYRMSRGNFNKLRRIGIIKKIKSRQQESAQTDGRYALSKSSFNGRPEEFLDFVEEMDDTNVSRRVSES